MQTTKKVLAFLLALCILLSMPLAISAADTFTLNSAVFKTETTIEATFSEPVSASALSAVKIAYLRITSFNKDGSLKAIYFGATGDYAVDGVSGVPQWNLTSPALVDGKPNVVSYIIPSGAIEAALATLEKYQTNVTQYDFKLTIQIMDDVAGDGVIAGFVSTDGSPLLAPALSGKIAYAEVTDERIASFDLDSAVLKTDTSVEATFSKPVDASSLKVNQIAFLRITSFNKDGSLKALYFEAKGEYAVDGVSGVPQWNLTSPALVDGKPNVVSYNAKSGAIDEALAVLEKYKTNVPQYDFKLTIQIMDDVAGDGVIAGFVSTDGSILSAPAFSGKIAYAAVSDTFTLDSAIFKTGNTLEATFSEPVSASALKTVNVAHLRITSFNKDGSLKAIYFGATGDYAVDGVSGVPQWNLTSPALVDGKPNVVSYNAKSGAIDEALAVLEKYKTNVPQYDFKLTIQIMDDVAGDGVIAGFVSADGSILTAPALSGKISYAEVTKEQDASFTLNSAVFKTETTIEATFSEPVSASALSAVKIAYLRITSFNKDGSLKAIYFGATGDYALDGVSGVPQWNLTSPALVDGKPNVVSYIIPSGAIEAALATLEKYRTNVTQYDFKLTIQIMDDVASDGVIAGFVSTDGSLLSAPALSGKIAYAEVTDERIASFDLDSAVLKTDTSVEATFSKPVDASSLKVNQIAFLRITSFNKDGSLKALYFEAKGEYAVDGVSGVPQWNLTSPALVDGKPNVVSYNAKSGAIEAALATLEKYKTNVPQYDFKLTIQIMDDVAGDGVIAGFVSTDGSLLSAPGFGGKAAYAEVIDDRIAIFTLDSAIFKTATTVEATFSKPVDASALKTVNVAFLRITAFNKDGSLKSIYFEAKGDYALDGVSGVPQWNLTSPKAVDGKPNTVSYTAKSGAIEAALATLEKYKAKYPEYDFKLTIQIMDDVASDGVIAGFVSADGSLLSAPGQAGKIAYAEVTDARVPLIDATVSIVNEMQLRVTFSAPIKINGEVHAAIRYCNNETGRLMTLGEVPNRVILQWGGTYVLENDRTLLWTMNGSNTMGVNNLSDLFNKRGATSMLPDNGNFQFCIEELTRGEVTVEGFNGMVDNIMTKDGKAYLKAMIASGYDGWYKPLRGGALIGAEGVSILSVKAVNDQQIEIAFSEPIVLAKGDQAPSVMLQYRSNDGKIDVLVNGKNANFKGELSYKEGDPSVLVFTLNSKNAKSLTEIFNYEGNFSWNIISKPVLVIEPAEGAMCNRTMRQFGISSEDGLRLLAVEYSQTPQVVWDVEVDYDKPDPQSEAAGNEAALVRYVSNYTPFILIGAAGVLVSVIVSGVMLIVKKKEAK